jgi:hypothetical protein
MDDHTTTSSSVSSTFSNNTYSNDSLANVRGSGNLPTLRNSGALGSGRAHDSATTSNSVPLLALGKSREKGESEVALREAVAMQDRVRPQSARDGRETRSGTTTAPRTFTPRVCFIY